MSAIGASGDNFLGGFMGTLSYVLTWIFIFGAAIVAMVSLYIYLPLRKRESYHYCAPEISCVTGLGLFLLLQLVLAGGFQPLPTVAFLLLLIPIGVKVLFSSLKDAVAGGADKSGWSGAVSIISAPSDSEEEDEDGAAEDVVLIHVGKDHVRTFSAVRVNPTSTGTTFGATQECVTLLTALSKFQNGNGGIEWVFKVDVNPSSGDAIYNFITTASGKAKRLSRAGADNEQCSAVYLVRKAVVYLRSALLNAGFTSGDESPVPGVELLKSLSISDDSGSGAVVVIRGLPEKVITVEDLESSSGQKQRSMSDSSSSSASLFHPVGRLVRSMVGENIAGSYVVRFRKTRPPEGIAVMDSGMIEATSNSGAYGARGSGSSSWQRLHNSVAGRLRLADREELAEEIMAGVRRGYWSVESYIALPEHGDDEDNDAAVRVSSTIVSCFSGGMRSVETSTLPIGPPTYESNFLDGCHPFVGDARIRYFTGDMSSDSLSSFINLSPPYPVNSESSLSAEFDSPPKNGVNGNGLLHFGRAFFRGTLVGDVKIPVEDLGMHVILLGETGFGKTTLVVVLLRQLWDLDPTINWVIVDLKGEYYNQLQDYIDERIVVLQAGGSAKDTQYRGSSVNLPFRIDLLSEVHRVGERDGGAENERIARLFSALKESLAGLFRENSELSPMMERILFESLKATMTRTGKPDASSDEKTAGSGFFDILFDEVGKYVTAHKRRDIVMSGEALKNRLERFRRGVIGDILNYSHSASDRVGSQNSDSFQSDFREMLRTSKIIIDLSGCVKRGCSKEDIRLLLNLITSTIFEEAFKRELLGAPKVRHLSIIEEANVLVPDVLRRKTMGDLTATEDMILTARGFGEGLILVAQRPTISSFVLANAGTKVVFRSPYDAKRVAEFMGLNEEQQDTVKSLKKFEAVVTTVQGGPYRISTAKPQTLETVPQRGHWHNGQTKKTESISSLLLSQASSTGTIVEASQDRSATVEHEDGDRNNANDRSRESISARKADVKRLLRGNSSAKLRLFKKIASSPKSGISVSDVIRIVFGGDRWEYQDAFRSLTDAAVWKRPLVTVTEERAALMLTEYGEQVLRAIQTDPPKRRRGIDG